MNRAKAKRQPKAAQIALKLTAAQVEKLHRAHDDLGRGICLVDVVIASLAGKEIGFPEQQALQMASKLLWPASEWLSDRRMDLPPERDEDDDEGGAS